MFRQVVLRVAVLFIAATLGSSAYGKSWHGIVPFHSMRADVENILGQAPCQDENGLGYQFENEDVYFVLARGDQYAECPDKISVGTVLWI
jgi:hypothetical protein